MQHFVFGICLDLHLLFISGREELVGMLHVRILLGGKIGEALDVSLSSSTTIPYIVRILITMAWPLK